VFSGIFSTMSSCSKFFISFSTFQQRQNGILHWGSQTGVTISSIANSTCLFPSLPSPLKEGCGYPKYVGAFCHLYVVWVVMVVLN
jgi:hypothetical protein